jgi:hypothetical protein
MTRIRNTRLQTPAAAVLAGAGIACAFGIRQDWSSAIIAAAVTLCLAGALYFIGGQDTDLGAVLGQRDDERQQLVALRAAQLSLIGVFYALVAACVIAAAVKHAFWPFEILVDITGVSYLIGLAVYGFGSDVPATEGTEHAHGEAIT